MIDASHRRRIFEAVGEPVPPLASGALTSLGDVEMSRRPEQDPPPADDIPPPADGDVPAPRDGAVGAATRYVQRFAMHPDGPTLRRWRGDFYRWTPELGSYARITEERVEASLYRGLQLTRPAVARDVRAALIAVDEVLIDEAELGSWIGEPAAVHPALDTAACANGLLHLPSRTLRPVTPRYFVTTSLGTKYDPAALPAERWLAFLRQLWPTDEQSIAALQEWFGYLLTPDTRQQKIGLFVGPKRSGKGTIARVLAALLGGADSVAAPTLASLGTNFGLWPLIGRTAAIIGDARLGGRTDIAQVVERLLSISGQDAQTIDRKHRESWTGYLSTRITIISNELPRFTDASDALSSRMLIFELTESFYGKEDKELSEKLFAELPGILLWAIEGWERLRRRGHFVQPEASAKLRDELEELASPVAAWLRERCERGPGPEFREPCADAFRDYQRWATEENHQHKVTLTKFGTDLRAAAQVKRVQLADGSRVYQGIRCKPVPSTWRSWALPDHHDVPRSRRDVDS